MSKKTITHAAIASAFTAAAAMTGGSANAGDMDKCFGVSLAGENDWRSRNLM